MIADVRHLSGINVYGSEALKSFEDRLTAAFERSYRQALQEGKSLADLGVYTA